MGVSPENDPAALAYWTDHPSTETSIDPLLWISMKSLVSVAAEFPPPPYTWLMTTGPATASTSTSRPAKADKVLGAVVRPSLEHAPNAPPKRERIARTLSERGRGIETPVILMWNAVGVGERRGKRPRILKFRAGYGNTCFDFVTRLFLSCGVPE